jgi:hypothetical protein
MQNQAGKVNRLPYLIIVMICFLLSCSESDNDEFITTFTDPLQGIVDQGELNFADPAVGQRSKFVLFKATYSYTSEEVTMVYQPDTLVLAITEQRSDRWIIKEFLTAGSDSRLKNNTGYWWNMADSVCQSNLRIDNDSIYVDRNAGNGFITFAFPQPQKFPFSLVSDQAPEYDNAFPLFQISNANRWTAYIENYDHRGTVFPRLNIYFNYTEVAFDGWGYTYVYGPSDGLVRIAWVSAWSPTEAAGWDLIPR